jgi:hypothetical protein
MMVKAKGGKVWHKKDKAAGVAPEGLRGLDKEATWSYSKADGWLYGHGAFCLTTHGIPLVSLFCRMPNATHEAKRREREVIGLEGFIETVCLDSKADDEKLWRRLREKQGIKLLTVPRRKMDKSGRRQAMIAEQEKVENRALYRQRKMTVEPMQGLMKEGFGLESCWYRGEEANRWAFAAMGVAVQIAQYEAYREGGSTWKIKEAVLGL